MANRCSPYSSKFLVPAAIAYLFGERLASAFVSPSWVASLPGSSLGNRLGPAACGEALPRPRGAVRRAFSAVPDTPEEEEEYDIYTYQPEYEMQDPETMFDGDEMMLEQWRLQRLLNNDLWQFGIYEEQHAGRWLGLWQGYKCEVLPSDSGPDDAASGLMVLSPGGSAFAASTSVKVDADGGTNAVVSAEVAAAAQQDYPSRHRRFDHAQALMEEAMGVVPLEAPEVVRRHLYPADFRAEKGSQVVGNCYTHGAVHSGNSGTETWLEIGLRDKDVRVRCLFNYRAVAAAAENGAAAAAVAGGGASVGVSGGAAAVVGAAAIARGQEEAPVGHRMDVAGVFVVREGLARLPTPDAKQERNLYGAAGRGLYDPPMESRNGRYYTIYAQGGLTIRFPLWVEGRDGGTGSLDCISVDWAGGPMRFQADRKMRRMDGSCEGLDLTEIRSEDAEKYLPMT